MGFYLISGSASMVGDAIFGWFSRFFCCFESFPWYCLDFYTISVPIWSFHGARMAFKKNAGKGRKGHEFQDLDANLNANSNILGANFGTNPWETNSKIWV